VRPPRNLLGASSFVEPLGNGGPASSPAGIRLLCPSAIVKFDELVKLDCPSLRPVPRREPSISDCRSDHPAVCAVHLIVADTDAEWGRARRQTKHRPVIHARPDCASGDGLGRRPARLRCGILMTNDRGSSLLPCCLGNVARADRCMGPPPEYGYVAITRDIDTLHGMMPTGTIGTIAAVYPGVYLVEFAAPWAVQ
jgi:hypothetical protein